jgi:hypothetical protein
MELDAAFFTLPFNKPGVWPFDPCRGPQNQGKLCA